METYVSLTNRIYKGLKKDWLLEINVMSYLYYLIQHTANMYTWNICNSYYITEPYTYEDRQCD
jgi:hypothetical protein